MIRLAELKAEAVAAQCAGDALVLGCDSMLDLDGEALGKPGSVDEARRTVAADARAHAACCTPGTA